MEVVLVMPGLAVLASQTVIGQDHDLVQKHSFTKTTDPLDKKMERSP